MNKKTRYIPEGYVKFVPEINYPENLFACYVNLEQPHNPRAIFFTGKQSKRTWAYRFANIIEMKKKIINSMSRLMEIEDEKKDRMEKKKLTRKNLDVSLVKIGDVYHWTGVYNCTKNAYVQVLRFVGKNKVEAVKLPKKQVSGDWMNGSVAPVLYNTDGDVIVLTIRPSYDGNKVLLRNTKVPNKYGWEGQYYKWSGKDNWENCD